MEITWKPEARKNIKEIYLFYMPKNEIAANKIVEDIKSSAGYLTVFPQMAPIEPSLGSRNETFRALLVSNRYKIIYYVDELAGEIVIVTVWDCHRNPEKLNELTN